MHEEPDKPRTSRRSSMTQAVTPKKALAEAIRHLGADATHAELVQWAKERFGLLLQVNIVIPRNTQVNAGRVDSNQERRKAC